MRKTQVYKNPKRQSLIIKDAQKIEIIEYYTKNKNNSIKELCIHFNISIDRCNTVINSFLKNNCLIVESKMNL